MSNLDAQSPVKRYGVAVVGSKYVFGYEDINTPDGVATIELRARRSLSFEEHLEHVRERAVIANMSMTMNRELLDGLARMNKATAEDAAAEGVSLEELQTRIINEVTAAVADKQVAQWERIKAQVIRLVNPNQHAEFSPILEAADPAHVNELLGDMEKELIERQREDTRVAASVDPTSQTPPSGSSDTPTSGPDSDSTE